MKRSTLKRTTRMGWRRPDEDKVSGLTSVLVMSRDQEALRKAGLMPTRSTVICIAPLLDPEERGKCWGRTTLDHVKSDLRMGKRAQSDAAHLVSLCQGHTEDGRRSGSQWNTRNRPALRGYLASQSV